MHGHEWNISKVWTVDFCLRRASSYSYDPLLILCAWELTEHRMSNTDINAVSTNIAEDGAINARLRRESLVGFQMFEDIDYRPTTQKPSIK